MGGLIRTRTSHHDQFVAYSGAAKHTWHPYSFPSNAFAMTIHLSPSYNAHLPPSQNPVNPPYHWHRRQSETFRISKGRFIFTFEGKDVVKSKEDGVITVSAGTYHTFRADPSCAA